MVLAVIARVQAAAIRGGVDIANVTTASNFASVPTAPVVTATLLHARWVCTQREISVMIVSISVRRPSPAEYPIPWCSGEMCGR